MFRCLESYLVTCVSGQYISPIFEGHVVQEVCLILEDETDIKTQQDRQCTYNVTLRLLHEAIVVVEKQ